MTKAQPPRANEIELSLFGRGFGECIVVHLGCNEWMIVDSCSNETNGPIALEYLRMLGVDYSAQVRLIVASHWHDDHTQGLAEIVQSCTSAQFVCSAALQNKNFLTLIAAEDEIVELGSSLGVTEFAKIVSILQQRSPSCPSWASEGRCIYRQEISPHVQVHALSPSDQSILDAYLQIGQLIPHKGDEYKRFYSPSPNDLSIVLVIMAQKFGFLLGGDLETGRDISRGWKRILLSPVLPKIRAYAYKVAHHGSPNADLPEIWSDMLIPDPYSILSTYNRGRRPLPAPDDIQRIRTRTEEIYCTSWPPSKKPEKQDRSVERTMMEVALNRRGCRQHLGHIRYRLSLLESNPSPTIELFDYATKL